MKVIKYASELTNYINKLRTRDQSLKIGFVPTMGALHDGHLTLIDASTAENEVTICSIFVNPTQFGEQKDLVTYPKPIEKDMELLINRNCDILYLPSVEDVYPQNYNQKIFDLNGVDFMIEGKQRPGHFQGVCNVIARFFEIINPDRAYFGQKDYQQTVVVKMLAKILNADTEIRVVPIAREANGLAMSSRNSRLSEEARQKASFINKNLKKVKEDIPNIGLLKALQNAEERINQIPGTTIEYLTAVNPESFIEIKENTSSGPLVVLTVVKYDGVRLLDNIIA